MNLVIVVIEVDFWVEDAPDVVVVYWRWIIMPNLNVYSVHHVDHSFFVFESLEFVVQLLQDGTPISIIWIFSLEVILVVVFDQFLWIVNGLFILFFFLEWTIQSKCILRRILQKLWIWKLAIAPSAVIMAIARWESWIVVGCGIGVIIWFGLVFEGGRSWRWDLEVVW